MGGDGTRRVPLMAASELNDSLKRDVLCRLKTLENRDQNIPRLYPHLTFFPIPLRWKDRFGCGVEMAFDWSRSVAWKNRFTDFAKSG